MVHEKHRSIIMVIQGTGDAVFNILGVLTFLYITRYWVHICMVIVCLMVPVILGIWWLPESPEFYYSKGRFQECEQVMLRIAKYNGVEIAPDAI